MNINSIKSILTLRYDYTQIPTLQRLTWEDLEQKKEFSVEDITNQLTSHLYKQIPENYSGPISISLSGGIDSSLALCLLKQNFPENQIDAISIKFSDSIDETETAAIIAKEVGVDHHIIEIDNFLEKLSDAISITKLPFWDIHWIYVAENAKNFSNYLVSGDGGDELFGGYRYYGRLLWLQRNIKIVPKPLLRLISKISQNHLPIGFTGKNWASALKVDFNSQLPHVTSFFDPIARRSLLEEHHFSSEPDEFFEKNVSDDQHLIQRATRMDVTNFLPEDILVKVDRSSMLNSLEVRAPFLDYKLVEYAFSEVPSSLKANHQSKKIILKSLAKKLLPKEFDRDRKQGFSVPMNDWLKEEKWKNITYDILNDSPIYNKKFINGLFKGISKGRNNGERLFGLTLFELWRKNNNLTL